MDVNNLRVTNFVYQGGDDCIAIKPRSYNIEFNNVVCNGGNGIAIGSLGQYLEDSSVNNVVINNATVRTKDVPSSTEVILRLHIGPKVESASYALWCIYQDVGR